MALKGETIRLGAPPHCPDCGKKLEEEIMSTPAGYFLGTQCCCGPYSRESEYYPSRELLEIAIQSGLVRYRTAEYQ